MISDRVLVRWIVIILSDGKEGSGDSDSYNNPLQFLSSILKQMKFVVFDQNLEVLLKFCNKCDCPIKMTI